MAGKGGGAWKVAYADFVTAMMAFFLVMWITAQSNSVKQAIAKYFEHPYDAASRSPVESKGSSGASLIPLHREMDGVPPRSNAKGKSALGGGMMTDDQPPDPASAPKSGGVKKRSGFMLRSSDQSGMGNVIAFPGDSAELDARAKQAINEMFPVFLGKLNKIEIRGHTNEVPGTDPAASAKMWQLSYERCVAIMRYFVLHGIEPKRIRLSQTGPDESRADDDDFRDPSQMARVEVYMLPEYVDNFIAQTRPDENKTESKADSSADRPIANPTADQPACKKN
ncbi:MAG TPA: flagellar motor protein MotB [Pirellulales bacterium]|jgi:chemotaxis protein MotB|nr:flagellar motor protein MotB [Pirellulales bacterium]